ncbi:phosphate acyltransferase PlsX [Endozoicomonas sp. Mp262]|uniref:phosphate acyltransferase PlsX n=1 Tax=Endozoicomonas sp. Mp262 TaxID=2919499 RepID=UPI0021DAB0E7
MPGRSALQGMKIALDIMSGDESPRSRICSVARVLKSRSDIRLILIGDKPLMNALLVEYPGLADSGRIEMLHADTTIAMGDRPSQALRSRKGSSMWKMLEQVANGNADACVSAGNTGALMAMGRYLLKTFSGVDRPAIATSLPCGNGETLLLDIGANVDSTSANLYQFAVMGSRLSSSLYGIAAPRVALLNVGTEDIKGSEQVRLAHQILLEDGSLNYTGYIEGHAIFTGLADVIVCDGFAGNIALKTAEGVANLARHELTAMFQSGWWRRLLGLMVSPVLSEFGDQINPVLYNGASFLGLQGIVVKSHGSADEKGFYQAICRAIHEVESGVQGRLAQGIEDMLMR